jgi:parvulin-like peptidyl-prolyl isomerase
VNASQASRRVGTGAAKLPLAVFGGLFVVLFAVFAVAQGIGNPSIPSDAIAVVEDIPGETVTVTDCNGDEVSDDPGTITEAEFDCALRQTAARAGLQRVPEPGQPQYEDLRQAAIGDLLDTIWIRGEAADQGVSVSQRQADAELDQIVTQNFRCPPEQDPFACPEFQRFLEQSSFSRDDVLRRVELQALSGELQQKITEEVAPVSREEIEEYYEAAEEQFTLPATRDVRLVLNRNESDVEQAQAELEEDSSDASWQRVARQFSTDPTSKDNGGLRPGLTEGLLEEPLNREIFAAAEGEIVGPVETPLGFYVFEVVKSTPERTQPLEDVQGQIRTLLAQQQQQLAFAQFVDDYGSKWQARTFCAGDFLIERCANFTGSGHPETAPPTCYQENPRGGRPDACPAPVLQTVPALPGTVTVLAPQGQPLPQRPRPAGLQPPRAGGLPGASPGLPLAPPSAP